MRWISPLEAIVGAKSITAPFVALWVADHGLHLERSDLFAAGWTIHILAERVLHRLPGDILLRGGWGLNFCRSFVCGLGSSSAWFCLLFFVGDPHLRDEYVALME